jgi:alcohol dehydrogenase (NADP+)
MGNPQATRLLNQTSRLSRQLQSSLFLQPSARCHLHHKTRFASTSSTNLKRCKLNTGTEIPALGFGTWQDVDAQEAAVLTALKTGYRHIDTARVYGTEPAVGRALKKSGVPRDEVFVTTKLWNNSHHPDDVPKAFEASLKDLNTDYIDLFLMVCVLSLMMLVHLQ